LKFAAVRYLYILSGGGKQCVGKQTTRKKERASSNLSAVKLEESVSTSVVSAETLSREIVGVKPSSVTGVHAIPVSPVEYTPQVDVAAADCSANNVVTGSLTSVYMKSVGIEQPVPLVNKTAVNANASAISGFKSVALNRVQSAMQNVGTSAEEKPQGLIMLGNDVFQVKTDLDDLKDVLPSR
jgi:hypothetical protein